ncbi:hypothetical protein TIFTF001_018786 [Ficus carica]|uniref:Uncharacterized protein n=1 Tax=Ficus carica TaxID=3494 RepID=A0AA88D9L3_FICCA|nr:hypothetical protein TIFTF001_018786 [Ficus carica]
MWYLCENYHDNHDATEASFEFSIENFDWGPFFDFGSYTVKECGIRMLYLHDAEEFGINKCVPGEPDAVTKELELSVSDNNVDCDFDGQHSKRVGISCKSSLWPSLLITAGSSDTEDSINSDVKITEDETSDVDDGINSDDSN